jgi:hypothetical protein
MIESLAKTQRYFLARTTQFWRPSGMSDRIPIVRAEQLCELDLSDLLAGYRDGYEGEAEPWNYWSFSYW